MKTRQAALTAFALVAAAAAAQDPLQQTTPPPTTQQSQPPATQQPAAPPIAPNAPEMATHDVASSFVSRVNLVSVPVVVRDSKGKSIGTLTKENFQLFDKGKPQEITRFVVEDTRPPSAAAGGKPVPALPSEGAPPNLIAPERFVAYLFDDINLNIDGLTRVRKAAEAHLQTLPPTDRAAIFTSSGEVGQDFTDNRELLHVALLRIRPNIMTRVGAMNDGELRTYGSIGNIGEIIRRMSTMPGQRIIMMISPGFFTQDPQYMSMKADLIERAIRAKVIISAIDARGLYTDPAFDVSGRGGNAQARTLTAASMRSDVLAELSYGTGGTFYQNSNDYDEGFRRIAAAPEYVYVLGFPPQNLKSDGSFHGLKVNLKGVSGLTAEARRGYYAPRKSDDAAAVAKEEIQSALFSREELKELPIGVQTQFFKTNDAQAKLAVLVHLDIKFFKFRKADGRNNNNITVVSGIFDRNGNYLQGLQKLLELHLKDETMPKIPNGFTLRTVFDLPPGGYLVRTVVRDSEGQMMSATNGAVWIQ